MIKVPSQSPLFSGILDKSFPFTFFVRLIEFLTPLNSQRYEY